MSGDRLLFVGRLPHYLASVLCVEGGRRVAVRQLDGRWFVHERTDEELVARRREMLRDYAEWLSYYERSGREWPIEDYDITRPFAVEMVK